MGSGTYQNDVFKQSVVGQRVAGGQSMQYSRAIKSGMAQAVAHDLLNPQFINRAGNQIRECFDSNDHPNTTPIIVGFDLTGSNSHVAQLSQAKLQTLFGMLQRRGICSDPSVAVMGYGDAVCDDVPLQFSQFEASNAIDIALDNMYLESGGGGNGAETATLAWYFTNKFVVTDSYEKRGKKGYFIMIADESVRRLTREQVEKFIGTTEDSNKQLTPEYLAEKLMEKWNVFVLHVDNAIARMQNAREQYISLFGAEHVIDLENPNEMVETICALIGAVEETLDMDDAVQILVDSGASLTAAKTALESVSGLFKSGGRGQRMEVAAPNLML